MPPANKPVAEKERWGVERKLRIEFIFGMLLTVAGFIWYAGGVDKNLDHQRQRIAKLESIVEQLAAARYASESRMTKLEGRQEVAVEILGRVERTVTELNRKAR